LFGVRRFRSALFGQVFGEIEVLSGTRWIMQSGDNAAPHSTSISHGTVGDARNFARIEWRRNRGNSGALAEFVLREQPPDHEEGLEHNAPGHFGASLETIGEDDGNLHNLHTLPP
jgi:hypothetical protein